MKPVFFGDVSIHVDNSYRITLVTKGGSIEPLEFTKKEWRILYTLLKRPGMVCTPRMFAAELYPGKNAHTLPSQAIIKVLIYDIRAKLSNAGFSDSITSIWGRGYRLGDPAPSVVSDHIPEDLRNCDRWVPSRKARILSLIKDPERKRQVFAYFTDLSVEEVSEWQHLLQDNSELSLRSTRSWLVD